MKSSVLCAIEHARRCINKDPLLTDRWREFYETWSVSSDHEDIVNQAYRDFQRRLHGWGRINPEIKGRVRRASSEILRDAISMLVSTSNYLDPLQFDVWHKGTCDKLIKCWNSAYRLNYGQAQKWVNMSLKYYCCAGDEACIKGVLNYQKCLHVPLDNYVFTSLAEACDVTAGSKTLSEWFLDLEMPPWSKIDDYALYLRLQHGLRKVADANGVTPCAIELFQYDFDRLA